MPAAPAPSTTIFSISRRRFMASSTVVSSHGDDLVDQLLDERLVMAPGDGDGDALGDRRPAHRRGRDP